LPADRRTLGVDAIGSRADSGQMPFPVQCSAAIDVCRGNKVIRIMVALKEAGAVVLTR